MLKNKEAYNILHYGVKAKLYRDTISDDPKNKLCENVIIYAHISCKYRLCILTLG